MEREPLRGTQEERDSGCCGDNTTEMAQSSRGSAVTGTLLLVSTTWVDCVRPARNGRIRRTCAFIGRGRTRSVPIRNQRSGLISRRRAAPRGEGH